MSRSLSTLPAKKETLWNEPVDLSQELAQRLLHGLAPHHRKRLELFAREGGRVSVKQLLAATEDEDVRALSYFQGALSRKIRRLLGDNEKRLHLIGWDYASTKWDESHSHIIDGICYVTPTTAQSLRVLLPPQDAEVQSRTAPRNRTNLAGSVT